MPCPVCGDASLNQVTEEKRYMICGAGHKFLLIEINSRYTGETLKKLISFVEKIVEMLCRLEVRLNGTT